MPRCVRIGDRLVGEGQPCYVVAEIGINHNGNPGLVRKLIDVAADAGCDAVKFQKRTIELVYSQEELEQPRESPFGTTNGDLKRYLELCSNDYEMIDDRLRGTDMHWFASPWDIPSVEFLEQYQPAAYKVASATLTDHELLRSIRGCGRPVLLSTGMSTLAEVDQAVDILGPEQLIILQCTAAYPCDDQDIHLRAMETLRQRYDCPVGYSGHEHGLATTVAAVALGACCVERHITLDRSMFGSDQAASIEPQGLRRLVRDVRAVEAAMGDGQKRLRECEIPSMKKLRRVTANA